MYLFRRLSTNSQPGKCDYLHREVPLLTPRSDLYNTIIEIKVGTFMPKSFFVHKGVVCFYSGYFRTAANGSFAEAAAGVINLPTEDPAIVERFITWVYSRRFDDPDEGHYTTICKMWAFGDRRQISLLMNTMVDVFRAKYLRIWLAPSDQISFIYENTAPDVGLRRLAMHLISHYGAGTMPKDENKAQWPLDALWDLSKVLWDSDFQRKKAAATKAELATLDLCQFHSHEEGVQCPKAKETL